MEVANPSVGEPVMNHPHFIYSRYQIPSRHSMSALPRMELLENRSVPSASVLDNVSPMTRELVDWNAQTNSSLPADPTTALIRSVTAFSSLLGRPTNPDAAVRAANFPADVSGELAITIDALIDSHQVSA